MKKQTHPFLSFRGLTETQIRQIDHWVEEHPLRKVVEIIQEQFQRYISKSTLQRFATWRCAKEALGSSPEAVAAAEEINRFFATAKPDFSAATLHLLEQRAFQLALSQQDDEDLKALKDILFLIHRHDSREIWKRRVRVWEEKLALEKTQKEKPNDTELDRRNLLIAQTVQQVLNGNMPEETKTLPPALGNTSGTTTNSEPQNEHH